MAVGLGEEGLRGLMEGNDPYARHVPLDGKKSRIVELHP